MVLKESHYWIAERQWIGWYGRLKEDIKIAIYSWFTPKYIKKFIKGIEKSPKDYAAYMLIEDDENGDAKYVKALINFKSNKYIPLQHSRRYPVARNIIEPTDNYLDKVVKKPYLRKYVHHYLNEKFKKHLNDLCRLAYLVNYNKYERIVEEDGKITINNFKKELFELVG